MKTEQRRDVLLQDIADGFYDPRTEGWMESLFSSTLHHLSLILAFGQGNILKKSLVRICYMFQKSSNILITPLRAPHIVFGQSLRFLSDISLSQVRMDTYHTCFGWVYP